MRRVIEVAFIGAWLAIVAGQALAHRSSTYDVESSVSSNGEINLWLVNKYDTTVTYDLQVLSRDFDPIDEKLWRSNHDNDRLVLEPEEVAEGIVIEVKNPGKYYACTVVAKVPENALGVRSRVCLRLWYK